MKKLEDFDQKFALTDSQMDSVRGAAGTSTTAGPWTSTCVNNCGDGERIISKDNGSYYATETMSFNVEC